MIKSFNEPTREPDVVFPAIKFMSTHLQECKFWIEEGVLEVATYKELLGKQSIIEMLEKSVNWNAIPERKRLAKNGLANYILLEDK